MKQVSPGSTTEQTILFVSHSSRLYGAERSMLDLVSALPNRLRPMVLVPAEGALTAELRKGRIAYAVIPFWWWLTLKPSRFKRMYRSLSNLIARLKVVKHLKEQSIKLVYTNTLASPLGGLLAMHWKVPHVWHVREYVDKGAGLFFDYGIQNSLRFVDKHATKVLFNSHAVRDSYAPFLARDKLQVVYNGFLKTSDKTALFRARQDLKHKQSIKACILGSIQENKGQIDAIKAVAELKELGKRIELYLVGDGEASYQDKLEQLAHHLGISARVSWLGYRDDAMAVFQEADIALVCSRHEAFGRVVVEAMATGCPVVATNTGGIPEIIEPERSGLLYQAGDHQALARAILRLVEEPELYQSLSYKGAEVAYKRFTKGRYVNELVGIIDQLLLPSQVNVLSTTKNSF